MECKYCGREMPEDAKVCPFCGATADAGTSETQTEYGYGVSDQNQGGYSYGAPDQGQGGYSYGTPDQNQGGYSYGTSGQGGYSYGTSDRNQEGYSYGTSGQSQGGYSYGTSGQDQGGYSYGTSNQNQGSYSYGTPDYGQGNYASPQEPISGTPYMVFAILATLLCCLPLGIVAIVYAGRINTLQKSGDYAGARAAAKKAKTFTIVGSVIGLVVLFIYIALIVIGFGTHSILEPSDDSAYEQPQFTEDDTDWDTEEDDDEEEEETEEEVKRPAAEPAPISGELGASWDTYTVQINEKVLTLPCTVAELEASGLVLDTEDTPADYVINGREYILAYFMDANANEIMVDVINLEEGAKTVKECLIGGVSVWDYELAQGGLTVIFPGGIQIGTPVEELLSKYGEAEDVTEEEEYHTYTWYSEDYSSYCMIDIEAETGLVCNMSVEHYGE